MKNPFRTVTAIFQTPALFLLGAHACANAYQRSQGLADVDFPVKDAEGNVTMDFKLNSAGVVAADSAAMVLAALRNGVDESGNVRAEDYLSALESLKKWDDLTPVEAIIACQLPNATWRTSQYTARGEDRWAREVNQSFNLLPAHEKAKDKQQLQSAATFLLEQIAAE